jgi:hypothetical protein
MFPESTSQRVTAGDGCALFFLCARAFKKCTDDPSPPVTSYRLPVWIASKRPAWAGGAHG